MPFPGPWITPTTTRFAIATPATAPSVYNRRYGPDLSWDAARDGTSTSVVDELVAPADILAASPRVLSRSGDSSPFYVVGQGLRWFDLTDTPLSALVPYIDVPSPPGAVGTDYEHPNGTAVAAPATLAVTTGPSVINGPDWTVDIYQLPTDTPEIASGPGYAFFDSLRIGALGTYKLGTVTPGEMVNLTGFNAASPTSTLVYLVTPSAQVDSVFPYTDPPPGWAGLADVQPAVEYLGPRFRFLFDVAPPQRQFPRDDGLGISTHRSWPPPTSKQYGLRRGPISTYL